MRLVKDLELLAIFKRSALDLVLLLDPGLIVVEDLTLEVKAAADRDRCLLCNSLL